MSTEDNTDQEPSFGIGDRVRLTCEGTVVALSDDPRAPYIVRVDVESDVYGCVTVSADEIVSADA